MRSRSALPWAFVVFLCALVAGCGGGGGGGGSPPPPPPPATFSVGVTVTGLFGTGLVLQNNGGNALTVNANGAATFTTALASGTAYNVTVSTQPTATPAQTCTVSSGTGTVGSAAVTGIAVSCRAQAGRFLYVPNAATVPTANAVAGFTIDANTGALTSMGLPFATQGQAPRTLFKDPTGKFLYVYGDDDLNAAGPTTLTGFVVNAQTGALTPIPGLVTVNATMPAPPVFHPSGNFVYLVVSDPGLSANNTLRGFAIDATTGALTPIPAAVWGPIQSFEVLSSAVISPNGSSLYLASYIPSVTPPPPALPIPVPPTARLTQIAVAAQTGAFNPVSSSEVTAAGMIFYQLAKHPAGTHMYTRNSGPVGSLTSRFTLDGPSGLIGARTDFPTAAGFGVVVAPSSRVYFLELGGFLGPPPTPLPGNVVGYVDSATGAPSALTGTRWPTGGDNPLSITLDPTGRYIAMTNTGAPATVTVMKIDAAQGSLTSVAGSPYTPTVGTLPGSVAFDPSGRFAYLPAGNPASVSSYAINVDTGVPTFVDSETLLGAPGFAQAAIFGLQ
jgi:lactonase family protein with 7-bladed beta-propeller